MNGYVAEHHPPEHIRPQLDLGWRHEKQSVYLFEMRPRRNDKSVILHSDFAKASWVESRKQWNIYWRRANGNWQRYEPLEWTVNLQRFLVEIEKDPYGCFRG